MVRIATIILLFKDGIWHPCNPFCANWHHLNIYVKNNEIMIERQKQRSIYTSTSFCRRLWSKTTIMHGILDCILGSDWCVVGVKHICAIPNPTLHYEFQNFHVLLLLDDILKLPSSTSGTLLVVTQKKVIFCCCTSSFSHGGGEDEEEEKNDLQKKTSFYVNKRSGNQKPLGKDKRENTSSSLSDSSWLFLHKFYATYVLGLEEVVLVELQPMLIQM